MKAISARSRAYSLVEVIVTMALVIMLSAGGLASALVAAQVQAKASQTLECTAAADEALSVMDSVGRFAAQNMDAQSRQTKIFTFFAQDFAFAFRCGIPSAVNRENAVSDWSETLSAQYDDGGTLTHGLTAIYRASAAVYQYDYTDGNLKLTIRLEFGGQAGEIGQDTYTVRAECGKASPVEHTGVIA